MTDNIFKRPNGKYWTPEDVQELKDAKNYHDLVIIALRVLDRMPQPVVQICGPLTTGGLGSFEANAAEFDKAIFFFSQKGECIFDQMPFEEPMQRFKKDVIDGYDNRILEHFYLPLFRSGKIKKCKFLPDWKSSHGATWEHNKIEELKIDFIDLPKNWHIENNYAKRGVSSGKEDVENAIKNLSKGLFPGSFCKILQDIAGNKHYCMIMHADGAGTKSSLAYMHWKETGDLSVWKGVLQDSIVMNLDDVIAVGAIDGPMYLSGNIGRNKFLVPGEVINHIINSSEEILSELNEHGLDIHSAGGETADVGDLVRTIIIDNTMTVRMKRKDIINASNIAPGDIIVGLASFGQAIYEKTYNGGMGSNGLTGSRHDVFCNEYIEKYPESFDPMLLTECPELVYKGQYKVTDPIPAAYFENHPYPAPATMGELVLSPTRTYAPVIKQIIKFLGRKHINGIIHCSGGGQTKVLKYTKDVHIIKDNLFSMPPLFKVIKDAGEYHGDKFKEMYQNFNMGHRMELYVNSQQTANQIIDIANSFNIEAKIVGHVEVHEGKKLTIKSEYGEFVY